MLIVFIDGNEAEGLLSAGEGRQQFGSAEYGARVGQEHEVDARALSQRVVQVEQSAGDGDDLQPASDTESALDAEDSRGWVGELQSRRSRIGFGWQGLSHVSNLIMFPWLGTWDITEGVVR